MLLCTRRWRRQMHARASHPRRRAASPHLILGQWAVQALRQCTRPTDRSTLRSSLVMPISINSVRFIGYTSRDKHIKIYIYVPRMFALRDMQMCRASW